MERIKEILQSHFEPNCWQTDISLASQEITTYLIEECKKLKKLPTLYEDGGMGNISEEDTAYNQAIQDVIKILEGK